MTIQDHLNYEANAIAATKTRLKALHDATEEGDLRLHLGAARYEAACCEDQLRFAMALPAKEFEGYKPKPMEGTP